MKKLFILLTVFGLVSCVTKKKFQATQLEKDKIEQTLRQTTSDLADCEKKFAGKSTDYNNLMDELTKAKSTIDGLNSEVNFQKTQNIKLLDQLTNLSVISKEGAESIKKSLETIDKQSRELSELNSQIRTKDSLNLVLVMNLKLIIS
ncbi:MAG TPA: hypothetical protein PLF48_10050 [Chitinophagales bacterium]|nr:hypothetical protein [Chitinophagales bacterium]